MSVRGSNRGFGCGTLILLVIALLGVWSLAVGAPVWEWIR